VIFGWDCPWQAIGSSVFGFCIGGTFTATFPNSGPEATSMGGPEPCDWAPRGAASQPLATCDHFGGAQPIREPDPFASPGRKVSHELASQWFRCRRRPPCYWGRSEVQRVVCEWAESQCGERHRIGRAQNDARHPEGVVLDTAQSSHRPFWTPPS
jgi:hypothetical protein